MIIDIFQKSAYQAVNVALVYWNWLIGYRIAEETLNGNKRAEYGSEVIKKLSKELTKLYGKGFTKSNLYSFYKFYTVYPNIVWKIYKYVIIMVTLSNLTQVHDATAREWYVMKHWMNLGTLELYKETFHINITIDY